MSPVPAKRENRRTGKRVSRKRPAAPGAADKFALLRETGAALLAAGTREALLRTLRSSLPQIIPNDTSVLCLKLPGSLRFSVVPLTGSSAAVKPPETGGYALDGIPGMVMTSGEQWTGPLPAGWCGKEIPDGVFSRPDIRNLLAVPVYSGEGIAGALLFARTGAMRFNREDSAAAGLLGVMVGSSLKHETTVEDAQKRITQIGLIHDISTQMTSVLQLDELLRSAASGIQHHFNYFDVSIFLLAEDNANLVLEAHSGNFLDFLPHGYQQGIDKGIIGWVARTGEKLLCNDVTRDPRYLTYEYHDTRSELTLPIRSDGKVVGVLNVEDSRFNAFDTTDAIVLGTLSDQLGIAIRNARLYNEMFRANVQLTELDKLKSEFLSIVSHDFRSPLASIILAGKALLKNEYVLANQRVREYLQIIVDQANRLSHLAEDTLSITKIESGQLSYFFKIVNLQRLIQDGVSMVRYSSKHEVITTVDPESMFIKGDQAKLRQLVQNLVSNAVKYSPRGGKVNIVVENKSPEEVLVSISDEGVGIPDDQIGKLFQKFSRINVEGSRDIKGAGLGLWICREIVNAHGGRIWVESELGKGTTVRFTLARKMETPDP